MKAEKGTLVLVAALLAALVALPAVFHLPAGIATWVALRLLVPDVHRALGRTKTWLQAAVVLCLLGALFGPTDSHVLSFGLSKAGGLAGTTMVVRAYALIALASLVSSMLPVRRWAERIRHPLGRRLVEVVIIAANLVPVQLRALNAASSALRERRPGLHRLPLRLWLLAVHSALRAAMLAESVALDMAIADHNGAENKEAMT